MLKRNRNIILSILIGTAGALVQAQTAGAPPCPGYNPSNNTNLACLFATAIPTRGAKDATGSAQGSLSTVPATFAAQLSNLPVATAVSGTGITFVNGIPTFSSDSLGTILTQRGETLGRHRFFVSFNYQRFGFGSVDGIRLRDFDTVNSVNFPNVGTSFQATKDARTNLSIDQFTALGTFGLTSRIDLTLIVPFSTVNLQTIANATQYNVSCSTCANPNTLVSQFPLSNLNLGGSKSGPGDVTLSTKVNVFRSASEKTAMALGAEVRIPTGDELNYLGTGAYGVKPYFIASRRGKRFTPNANIGYQWNSTSSLYYDATTGQHLNLPASFLYTGGMDVKIASRLTLVTEFLGQYVINGPRVVRQDITIPGAPTFHSLSVVDANGKPLISSYAVDNAGIGFKVNPFGGLLISASAMFKLDDAGLRAKVVPLIGISYRF